MIDPAPVDALRDPGPPTRREWWTALSIVALGFLLRAALPGRMAVEHFDEGVYASNLYCGNQDPPHAYPDRHLYAPPLVPAILEWAIIPAGAHAAMWVNVLLGALTVFVVWWGARQCFGPAAGIVSAILAATSDVHIAFSRMALTDVPLCLWMAAGVFAGWRAVLTGRPLWICAAAACSALAWWTKHNGWLTLAVTGSGTAAWVLIDRQRSVSAGQAIGRWIAVAALAALLWLPFLWTLPAGSSYADISANHAKYFVGLSGWWPSLLRQAGTQRYLDGWSTVIGIALAAAAAAWVNWERFTWNGDLAGGGTRPWMWSIVGCLAAAVAAIACGSTAVLAIVSVSGTAVIGVRWASRARSETRDANPMSSHLFLQPTGSPPELGTQRTGRSHQPEAQAKEGSPNPSLALRAGVPGNPCGLAAWMIAAWFIGLLVATPLYHPYPRLALPWLTACWLAAGAVAGRLLDRHFVSSRSAARQGSWRLVATAILLIVVAGPIATWRGSPLAPPRWTAWQDRTGLQRVASELRRDAARTAREMGPSGHPQLDAVIYVYGEPGLFFQLEAADDASGFRYVSSPATSLELGVPAEVSVFLVTGPRAHRMGAERDPALRKYRPVAEYPYVPSDLVALDEYSAAQLLREGGAPVEQIRLFLVHGPLQSR